MTPRTIASETSGVGDAARHDVIIIGDGLIGLSTAWELSRSGVRCCLVGARRPGGASGAAAGLLAPTSDRLPTGARAFFAASLASYPRFIEPLTAYDPGVGIITGLIETLAPDAAPSGNQRLLDPSELTTLEPLLPAGTRAVLHATDGAVDNVRLVQALRRAVANESNVRWIDDDPVTAIDVDRDEPRVRLASGAELKSPFVVLAAGAWSPTIAGLPRRLPVHPLKGQLLALDFTGLSRPIMTPDAYVVPRERETVVGATVEHAGFDLSIDERALDALHAAAARVVPALASARIVRRWAGIRPATPDMLPIIGPEPRAPRLVYACGHSKNGILLAPATAAAVRSIVTGGGAPDLAAFAPDRFDEP